MPLSKLTRPLLEATRFLRQYPMKIIQLPLLSNETSFNIHNERLYQADIKLTPKLTLIR